MKPIARSGDDFTAFLQQEDKVLAERGLGKNARELALRLAVAYRQPVAASNSGKMLNVLQRTLVRDKLQQGVTLLCSSDHSPANNESTASWLAWSWAATEFFGGLAIVAVNVASSGLGGPLAAMSVALGATAIGSGYNDAKVLYRRQ